MIRKPFISFFRFWRNVRSAPRRVRTSPLTRKVLAINSLSLILLLGGLLYMDQYRKSLLHSELQSLNMQALIFAGALGESAVETDPDSEADAAIIPGAARDIIRRLVPPTRTRARLFDNKGALIIDSRMLGGKKGKITSLVQIEDLDTGQKKNSWIGQYVLSALEESGSLFSSWRDLPVYQERNPQSADHYNEVGEALSGHPDYAVRRIGKDDIVLSVAVPVQRYRHVLGALMISKTGDDIEKAVSEVQYAILKAFLLALIITSLLSAYLAGTLTQPITRLADAAKRMYSTKNRHIVIPDLSSRQDEIGDLSVALRELTGALWNRMDAIERFAADVAHEIKNPLNSLRSAVETAARVEDPRKQKQLLQIVRDDVVRLDRLISDISEASRVDSDISKTEIQRIDIMELLAPIVEAYNQQQRESGITVDLFVDPTRKFYAEGIAMRLTQAMRNLIDNAISFSPKGGTVGVHVEKRGGSVVIEVTDDGVGIPPDRVEKIFERFYTDRPSGEKFGTHSGLGLSISRQIVAAMGGAIEAENRIGPDGKRCGALFRISLPAV